ncbi:PepSY domain-containing protein [Vibrio sp.]|nr:PepSY domain-containing protein [Vibrio sp.]
MQNQQSRDSYLGILALLKRLHFYIGLFIGPFIFTAALTGTLYVLAPQIEASLYHHALTGKKNGSPHSLEEQIKVARQSLDRPLTLQAVRPSIGDGYTSRILFSDPDYNLQLLTVFVDPITLDIRDTLPTYGTSGVLPFMTQLDFLHRSLLLGETGRIYSELAASWMWFAAVGGVVLWYSTRRQNRRSTRNAYISNKSRHQKAGLIILLGMIFFSATGLTWSKWAGGNIAEWRKSIGWVTPSVTTALTSNSTDTISSEQVDAQFDSMLAIARDSGLTARKIELRPSYSNSRAWMIREIDRSWPTQVDAISVNAQTMAITSEARFSDYPLIAKLIRWGIDAHMGVLFGLPNQLILAAFGITLCLMIIWGYKMWWTRRPPVPSAKDTVSYIWLNLSPLNKCLSIIVAVGLGLALPVMGCSLLLLLVIDIIRWRAIRSKAANADYNLS